MVRYKGTCPQITVTLPNGSFVRALLDTGVEVNLIRESVALNLGYGVSKLPHEIRKGTINGVGNGSASYIRIIRDAPLDVFGVTVTAPLLVVEDDIMNQDLILRQPYASRSSLSLTHYPSGSVKGSIVLEDSENRVRFQANENDAVLIASSVNVNLVTFVPGKARADR